VRTPRVVAAVVVASLALSLSDLAARQGQPAAAKPAPQATAAEQPSPMAVKIDIVLSRSKGTTTLSSLPYSINAVEKERASLRLGSSVPIPTGGSAGAPAVSYQSVGSNIDCHVTALGDGRYHLTLAMEDSSLAESSAAQSTTSPVILAVPAPVIRSYRVETALILRDGQSSLFNVATDRVSGETVRAQVTLTALK
jgi:Flp pilus assembly secretin CpaC